MILETNLRDTIAIEAMKILLKVPVKNWPWNVKGEPDNPENSVSLAAYLIADAMLAARKEPL
jgi:hypothetical protein